MIFRIPYSARVLYIRFSKVFQHPTYLNKQYPRRGKPFGASKEENFRVGYSNSPRVLTNQNTCCVGVMLFVKCKQLSPPHLPNPGPIANYKTLNSREFQSYVFGFFSTYLQS